MRRVFRRDSIEGLAPTSAGEKVEVMGWIDRSSAFLREVRSEMAKVTWPTGNELKGQTLVVIIAVLLIAAFIGLVDLILNNTIRLLITAIS
jgi:preprotein translocase subunit SecE